MNDQPDKPAKLFEISWTKPFGLTWLPALERLPAPRRRLVRRAFYVIAVVALVYNIIGGTLMYQHLQGKAQNATTPEQAQTMEFLSRAMIVMGVASMVVPAWFLGQALRLRDQQLDAERFRIWIIAFWIVIALALVISIVYALSGPGLPAPA